MRLFYFILALDFQHGRFFLARSVWHLTHMYRYYVFVLSVFLFFFFFFSFQETGYLQCAVAGAGQPDGLCECKLQWDLVHMQSGRLDILAQPTTH